MSVRSCCEVVLDDIKRCRKDGRTSKFKKWDVGGETRIHLMIEADDALKESGENRDITLDEALWYLDHALELCLIIGDPKTAEDIGAVWERLEEEAAAPGFVEEPLESGPGMAFEAGEPITDSEGLPLDNPSMPGYSAVRWYEIPEVREQVFEAARGISEEDVRGEIARRVKEEVAGRSWRGRVQIVFEGDDKVSDDPEITIVVMVPDRAPRDDAGGLLDSDWPDRILAECGGRPRRYRNAIAFVAAESGPFLTMQRDTRDYLAIFASQEGRVTGPRRRAIIDEADTEATRSMRRAFSVLMAPRADSGYAVLQTDCGNIADSAAKAMRYSGLMIGWEACGECPVRAWTADELMTVVGRFTGASPRKMHIGVRELWEIMCSECSTPRLESPELLLDAVREGQKRNLFLYADEIVREMADDGIKLGYSWSGNDVSMDGMIVRFCDAIGNGWVPGSMCPSGARREPPPRDPGRGRPK